MLILRTVSPWILVSILALLSVCSGARDRSGSKGVTSGNAPSRGRFNLKNGMQCTWATKNVSDVVKMSVKCENPQARIDGGVTELRCEYRAKPQTCPGYQSNSKGYYKQVSRALKRLQEKVCREPRALAKAAMCKRAPQDAHFKLDIRTSVSAAQSGGDTLLPRTRDTTTTTRTKTTTSPATPAPGGTPADCKGRGAHRQVAQEYCNSSWASVCAFFFSMLQSEDC